MPTVQERYKGFTLLGRAGLFHAIPEHLGELTPEEQGWLHQTPGVLTAATKERLAVLIDELPPPPQVEAAEEFEGHDLVPFRGRVCAIPRGLGGPVNLNREAERAREGIVWGATAQEVKERILGVRSARPVEYAGWLPVFRGFGNCGAHPQFAHTQAPPAGYRFVRSRPRRVRDPLPCLLADWIAAAAGAVVSPPWAALKHTLRHGPLRFLRTAAAATGLALRLLRAGAPPWAVLQFVRSRHFGSQIALRTQADLVFLTSVPYTYGQRPWVIEVEDSTTLFYPFLRNGDTHDRDVRASPYFRVVKALLESDRCRGILTHMRSTAESLPTLFQSEVIARKTTHIPLGVGLPPEPAGQDGEHVELLFTNSWHQNPQGFFLRGGLDVLEAFAVLRRRYPQVRLTLRAHLPPLERRYYQIIEEGGVRVINRFLSGEEMDDLQRRAQVYLLPAARIHIVSLLQAMAYGQAVVVSDGWGFGEYVEHGRNGLVVGGRARKVSWMDERAGVLREDYRPLYRPDPQVVGGLVESVSRLIEDGALRRRLGQAARHDAATKYNLEQWNRKLKSALDRATRSS